MKTYCVFYEVRTKHPNTILINPMLHQYGIHNFSDRSIRSKFAVAFLDPRANEMLLIKFGVAMHSLHAAHQH
jgi:hypothetical protein